MLSLMSYLSLYVYREVCPLFVPLRGSRVSPGLAMRWPTLGTSMEMTEMVSALVLPALLEFAAVRMLL